MMMFGIKVLKKIFGTETFIPIIMQPYMMRNSHITIQTSGKRRGGPRGGGGGKISN
jgi:hypothetical protein